MTEPDRYARFQRGARSVTSIRDLVPRGFRPDEDERPVTRIKILVEREGGGWTEYDAVEPLNVQLSPGLAMTGAHTAGAKLSVAFVANPRWNLRIWTPGGTSRDWARNGLEMIAEALGYRLQPKPGLRSGLEAAVRAEAEESDDRHACPQCGRGAGQEPPVAEVFVRIRRADGSQQEITASWPEPFLLKIGAKDQEAALPAGMAGPDRKEPLIAVLFGGNAGVGGIRVRQTGISRYGKPYYEDP